MSRPSRSSISTHSDIDDIGVLDNLAAADAFAENTTSQVNQEDVLSMLVLQREMLSRFEKTNEMLVNCNALAAARIDYAHQEFKRHTQLLIDMKRDLDNVFRRIRKLKANLGKRYPDAFAACSPLRSPPGAAAESTIEEGNHNVPKNQTVVLADVHTAPVEVSDTCVQRTEEA